MILEAAPFQYRKNNVFTQYIGGDVPCMPILQEKNLRKLCNAVDAGHLLARDTKSRL